MRDFLMSTQYRCKNQQRRTAVLAQQRLNGIDYLEVSSDQKTLLVHFLHNLPGLGQEESVPPNSPILTEENVAIEGGMRLTNIQVESVSAFAKLLTVRVNTPGDFSTYTLRLVKSPDAPEPSANLPLGFSGGVRGTLREREREQPANLQPDPPSGFDPQLSQVEFSFRVDDLGEFDCKPALEPPPEKTPPPITDYQAKDYASFRQLMLNRLAVTMPQWQERNPADIGIVLVELLAYAADHLSYYQDAVATEAYLGTARKRVSVRRHARLLDYLMHDGCNARAWVALQVNANGDGIKLLGPSKKQNRPGTQLLTKVDALPPVLKSQKDFDIAINAGAQVFETLHDLTLHSSCNEIYFYTWGDEHCYLPAGATQATLKDNGGVLCKHLVPGNVLIFEERLSPNSGRTEDANPVHRHAVRLTEVIAKEDPLFPEESAEGDERAAQPQRVVEIRWAADDALPFPLYLSTVVNDKPYKDVSVARGNVVLVDRGRTIFAEELDEVPTGDRYRPRLKNGPLTQQGQVRNSKNQWVPFDENASASAALRWEMRDTKPCIGLEENDESDLRWLPQRDLLISDRFDRHFVVETEDDGRAYLRFGDNVLGKRPAPGTQLTATYRVGNGSSGNVGAEAIAHIFSKSRNLQGIITKVRNPLPARGGTEPESIEQVRLYAPQAFRTQKRAVTEADYAAVCMSYPGVQRAVANRRWTGSWYTIFITVDREGGRLLDGDFERELRDFLEPYRLAGHDLEIESPRFVPLDIALTVQVAPDYFSSDIKEALLSTFSNKILPNGQPAFFNPDKFSFGEPVYLSQVVAKAMQVPGVRSVRVTRFQRWKQPSRNEIEVGQISFEPLEIARLDNDPNAPENGRISFDMEGGL